MQQQYGFKPEANGSQPWNLKRVPGELISERGKTDQIKFGFERMWRRTLPVKDAKSSKTGRKGKHNQDWDLKI